MAQSQPVPVQQEVETKNLAMTVVALQGRPLSSDAPDDGQVLVWDGTMWVPGNVALGADLNLYLPLSGGTLSGNLAMESPNPEIDLRSTVPSGSVAAIGVSQVDTAVLTLSAQSPTVFLQQPLSGASYTLNISGLQAPYDDLVIADNIAPGNTVIPLRITRASGLISVLGPPTSPTHIATKGYVDSLVTAGVAAVIGVFEASTGVCHYGPSSGYPEGDLISAATAGAGKYLACDEAGTPPAGTGPWPDGASFNVGDWVISDGTDWIKLALGGAGGSAGNVAVIPPVAGGDTVQAALEGLNAQKLALTGGTLSGNLRVDNANAEVYLRSTAAGSSAMAALGTTQADTAILTLSAVTPAVALQQLSTGANYSLNISTVPPLGDLVISDFVDSDNTITPLRVSRNSGLISVLGPPTAPAHIATKSYADGIAGGVLGNPINMSVGAGNNEWVSGIVTGRVIGKTVYLRIQNNVKDTAIAANTWRNRFVSSFNGVPSPPNNLWVPVRSGTLRAFAEILSTGVINIYAYDSIPVGNAVELNWSYSLLT